MNRSSERLETLCIRYRVAVLSEAIAGMALQILG